MNYYKSIKEVDTAFRLSQYNETTKLKNSVMTSILTLQEFDLDIVDNKNQDLLDLLDDLQFIIDKIKDY